MRVRFLQLALGLFILAAPLHAAPLDVAGSWKLNRALSGLPEQGTDERSGEKRPGGGGGRGGRGGGGRGGFGGFGGFGGGGSGGPSESEMHKMEVVRRRFTEIAERLIIVHDGNAVSITDGYGKHIAYKADGKKQEQVTGDGEFKTKTHFEGWKLIIEEDLGGPKVTTTYTPTLEGGELRRLEVAISTDRGGFGGPGGMGHGGGSAGSSGGKNKESGPGGPPPLVRIYDWDAGEK